MPTTFAFVFVNLLATKETKSEINGAYDESLDTRCEAK
jgi:hypothetical protein